MPKRYLYFLPAVVGFIIIFWLSATSTTISPAWDWDMSDKVGHIAFYALETLLLIWGMAKSMEWSNTRIDLILVCVGIAGFYGFLMELMQANLPHRTFDYADMLANFIGAFASIIVYYLTSKRWFLKH